MSLESLSLSRVDRFFLQEENLVFLASKEKSAVIIAFLH